MKTLQLIRQKDQTYKRLGKVPDGVRYVRIDIGDRRGIAEYSIKRALEILDAAATKNQLRANIYTLVPVTAPASEPRSERAPRKPKERKPKAEKVAGLYAAGKAMANLYLVLSDGKVHTAKELKPALNGVPLAGRMRRLVKEGPKTGRWTIKQLKGERYQMILSKGGK